MICNKCNATIEDDSVFCKKCGNMVKPKTNEVCLSYANEVPKGRGIYGSDIALEAPKETSSVTGQFYGEDLHYVPPKENNETTANNYTAYNQVAHRTNANSSLHSIYSSATDNYSRSTSRISLRPLVRLFAFVLIILGVIFFISREFGADSKPTSVSDPDSKLVPMIKPESGTILHGRIYDDDSAITITASGSSSCVVKLKTAAGVTKLSFFVRAGDTVTVGVPAEYLYVYFASGETWYGTSHLFGKHTSYSMDDELLNFKEYTWEYTLYPVHDGNFSQTPIDAEDF